MSQQTKSTSRSKSGIYSQGILVAVVLAVLTIAEYFVAIWLGSAALLLLLALAKGGLVVYYFMHISSLWSDEGGH